ncbi:hypothetical protein B1729_07825 [Microbacterium sp. B35-04]|uniref:hypothetical protein n=1 Tax=Microbacterium sp. B35-30 TaxID=1962642 RepID=UPI001EF9B2C5|nr:hypothetical protein [Microbacterium sp. B35-30]KAF2413836.1 hypothetical protein B1729_07825 [Microbacterium sp. B35-04]KAF2420409.1 hypothetical protein B2K11_01660 [Microbacterium sp. B35-30]
MHPSHREAVEACLQTAGFSVLTATHANWLRLTEALVCALSTPARHRRRAVSKQPEVLANVLDTDDSATQVKSTP